MKLEIHSRRFWLVDPDGRRRQFAHEIGLNSFDSTRKANETRARRREVFSI